MKCKICEGDLEYDQEGHKPALYCANKHCDVNDPQDYKIKGEGFLYLKLTRPFALSSNGWGNWDALAKSSHPIRYYLSETVAPFFTDMYRSVITHPLNWIRYRTYNRYHRVSTGLEPGWRDVDAQMLSTNFTMLVDFIEIEKASCMLGNEDEVNTHKWYQKGPFDNWRDASLGVKHLEWEMTLTRNADYGLKEGDKGFGELTRQAVSAKEQFELYHWWKEVRPLREDAMDASGLSEWYDSHRADGTSFIDMMNANREARKEDPDKHKGMMDLNTKIEEDHDAEDLAMLIRLMTIRQSLWS